MDINKDPTVPPPSYEEATDRKEPSAPYYQWNVQLVIHLRIECIFL
jgi:hypothetical protein